MPEKPSYVNVLIAMLTGEYKEELKALNLGDTAGWAVPLVCSFIATKADIPDEDKRRLASALVERTAGTSDNDANKACANALKELGQQGVLQTVCDSFNPEFEMYGEELADLQAIAVILKIELCLSEKG